jgi:hypothetical protein
VETAVDRKAVNWAINTYQLQLAEK